MAKKQTVMWTALPNGLADGKLKLSVFVSPRLETDEGLPRPTLSQFTDFLAWPAKVQNMKFQVQFAGQAPVDATRVGPDLEPNLWAALFKETTYVEPYKFDDYSNRAVLSQPVRHLETFVRSQYQSVAATSPTRLPTRVHVMEKLAPITLYTVPNTASSVTREQPLTAQHFKGTVTQQASPSGTSAQTAQPATRQVVIPKTLTSFISTLHPNLQPSANRNIRMLARGAHPLSQSTVSAFQSVYQELQQYKAVRTTQFQPARDFLLVRMSNPAIPETIEPLQPPELDFHKIVASLGSYPELMKVFGLVINLEVPMPAGLAPSSTVRVIPQWTPDASTACPGCTVTPNTAYILDTSRSWFAPRPEKPDSDILNGLLKLNDHQSYPVMSVDVDGSAVKMANLADRLASSSLSQSQSQTSGMRPMMLQTTPGGKGGGQPQASSATTEQVERGTQTVEPKELLGLPALRTGGLTVSKAGKAEWLVNVLSRATLNNQAIQKNPPDQVTLYAEDVVRGYRVDVWDSQSKSWHSLCRRVGTYNFFEAGLLRQYQDEGFVQLAATQSSVQTGSTPDNTQDLYLQESMFSWNGWSLCAPRPGKPINPAGVPQALNDPNQAQDRTTGGIKMTASFVAMPGSLPRLRFGDTYRVRARVVDLAGNGLAYDAPNPTDFSTATDPHYYNRFEPVVGPLAVLTQSLVGTKSPGEALYRPVIRSNFDKSAEQYAPAFANLVSDSQYTVSPTRLVAPPKTSELMAERHGMFDLASGGMKKDQATYQMIAKKSAADFLIDPVTRLPIQPKLEVPYLADPLSRGMSMVMLDATGSVAGTVPPVSFYPSGAVWPDALPFFIKVVEGTTKTAWSWDESSRTLTVQLPKAEVAKFELSSYLGEGHTGSRNQSIMGVWNWVQQARPANLAHIRSAAAVGRFWMITPSRELLLVHAVQQPLVAPQFHHLSPTRHLAETFAYIVDDQAMPIDGKSTLKVDIAADWQEMIDDVNNPTGPHARPGNSHVHTWDLSRSDTEIVLVMQQALAKSSSNQGTSQQDPPASGQTESKVQTYPLMKIQRSSQKQTQQEQGAKGVQETIGNPQYNLQPGVKIPNDIRFFHPPQYRTGVEKFGYSWRHDFGDTKYRKINYQAVATTRFKEYFPKMETDQLTRTSPAVSVDVPNSARPAQPNVLYVLPTFGWDRKQDVPFDSSLAPGVAPAALSGLKGVSSTSKRRGGGLRIYLDRPWFSSGDGEMLGVVVWPSVMPTKASGMVLGSGSIPGQYHPVQDSSGQRRNSKTKFGSMLKFQVTKDFELPEALKPVVTQWGVDPIWASNPLPGDLPKFENFTKPDQIAVGLTLPELEGLQDPSATYYNVGVAAYTPQYDQDRQLWYCDIEIDAGDTYFPFIRLALVRYQPISVPNAHLSRVVLADLAQLTPDRTAVMVYNPKHPKKIDLVVAGLTYAASSAGKGPSLLEASVESNPSGADNELGWVPLPNATAVMQPKLIGQQTVWKYQFHLDKLKPPKRQALRLVIKEFEVLDADRRAEAGEILFATGQPMTGRRLVYAEILKMPPIS
ncbi:MAG TPA: hypothetical protein VMW54_12035 [Terriglobia bacterium]|nr:hypothetical protein [Terriglobia bacterium]